MMKLQTDYHDLQNELNTTTKNFEIHIDTLNLKLRMKDENIIKLENEIQKYKKVLKDAIIKNSDLEHELMNAHKKLYEQSKLLQPNDKEKKDINENFQDGNNVVSENLLGFFFPKSY